MNAKLLLFFLISLFFACKEKPSSEEKITINKGLWKAELDLGKSKTLPFILDWKEGNSLTIHNAEERIEVTEISITNDSIRIQMPVYEGFLEGKIISEKQIKGNFVKAGLNRVVPFEMNFGNLDRFKTTKNPKVDVSGVWEVTFSQDSNEDFYIAKGIFKQEGKFVTGTFRTTTGDYRYLEGLVDGNIMKLSTFDGAHAFLFEAEIKDSIMQGIFYSGNHWQEPFIAKRNNNFELPDSNKLTFLKEGYGTFDFSFPDTGGNIVSLSDARFKNKVVIVQIMGTWCPNCLDETKYYTQYLKNNPNKDIEFIALAFEYAKTKEAAFKAINRLKEMVGVPYPILLAQFGNSSKQKANEKLPMLNHVLSYPTTIFIDKKGKVRKIHTGFNGPATGEKYATFKVEFEVFLRGLLGE